MSVQVAVQTEDLVFSAIIPIIDTSKLVIKFFGEKTLINDYFSPSEKSKQCQGWSRSTSSQDWQLCFMRFYSERTVYCGSTSTSFPHTQSKLRIFPACTCLYVAGINKWSEWFGWLTGTARLSCCASHWCNFFSCLCNWALPFPTCYQPWGSWLEKNIESQSDIAKLSKGVPQGHKAC